MKIKFTIQIQLIIGIFLSVLFLGTHDLSAQTRLSDSFNYAPGPLKNSSWVQQTAGTPNIAVVPGNLEYDYSFGVSMGNKVLLTSSGENVRRGFTPIPTGSTGQSAYFMQLLIRLYLIKLI
ncbi:hypothetical protein MM236_19335 [Belliella sp. DSM 107340]|uniref:Uncharacterized protein n=1 Tax=Belliella calami TaxID=2923436 RepID=A0ABS9UU49_9BACT|nr:hypothetical protein [Belliella calami]MCH7400156.1 hypothetical protein [Belliella calami]